MPIKQGTERHDYRNIVAVGASAGGVKALLKLVEQFPQMHGAVFVVLHTSPHGSNSLPHLLDLHSRNLRVRAAQDGLPIAMGNIYVAVPDHHLIVELGQMRLVRGPLENRQRPAIDMLFRSAARSYGPRVVGVVLSGYLDDGSAGLLSIKRAGGVAVVQDPNDAMVPAMPESAIATVPVDYICTIAEMPNLLSWLVQQPVGLEQARVLMYRK